MTNMKCRIGKRQRILEATNHLGVYVMFGKQMMVKNALIVFVVMVKRDLRFNGGLAKRPGGALQKLIGGFDSHTYLQFI